MRVLPFQYATRNLLRSKSRLLLIVSGNVLVVMLVLLATAFISGMNRSLLITGSDANIILLGNGSQESLERSQIEMRTATIASTAFSNIRSRMGVQYVSPEIHQAMLVKTDPEEPKGRRSILRGITPTAYLVHPQVHIVEGRAPEAGRNELLVGSLVASKLDLPDAALTPGATLYIDDVPFTVSGRFEAPQTVLDAEIWIPLTDLQIIAQRDTLSCVVITLDPVPGKPLLAEAESFALQRIDLELAAITERGYYRQLAAFFTPIRFMVIATAALIALGGIIGGLNTLYAAFAARVRELGTLQVLGFRRLAVVYTLLQESVLASLLGTVVAAGLGLLLIDGIAIRYSMGAFGLIVDGSVLLIAIIAGFALGVIGAIPPAWRCLRLPIPEALKSG
jgi:putative ABC transport system permease protein